MKRHLYFCSRWKLHNISLTSYSLFGQLKLKIKIFWASITEFYLCEQRSCHCQILHFHIKYTRKSLAFTEFIIQCICFCKEKVVLNPGKALCIIYLPGDLYKSQCLTVFSLWNFASFSWHAKGNCKYVKPNVASFICFILKICAHYNYNCDEKNVDVCPSQFIRDVLFFKAYLYSTKSAEACIKGVIF